MPPIALEISVADPSGVHAAFDQGADRVEVCIALELGGLTPSRALVEHAVEYANGREVHVLVRAVPGGFVYSSELVDLMCRDIAALSEVGPAAFVVGALRAGSAGLDHSALAGFRDAAGGIPLTMHRAIDVLKHPQDALLGLDDLGITRVLTSGGAARSIDGIDTLRALIDARGPAVTIGGGVRPDDIPALAALGPAAIHCSARTLTDRGPAGWGGGAISVSATSPILVRAARCAIDSVVRGTHADTPLRHQLFG